MRNPLQCFIDENSDIVPEFTKVLKSLYYNEINVFVEASKSKESLYKVLYATENEFTVMTYDYIDSKLIFPAKFKSWYNTRVHCRKIQRTKPNSWEMTRRLTDAVFEDKKETHTRFHCEIWSPTFDGSKVEDTFIPLWKEFNTNYGHLNDC